MIKVSIVSDNGVIACAEMGAVRLNISLYHLIFYQSDDHLISC